MNDFNLKISKSQLITFFVLFFLLATIPIGVYLIQRSKIFKPQAAAQVSFYLEPASATMPPDTMFILKANSGANKVGFVRVRVNFNPAMVKLSREVQATGPLSNVVSITSMAEANSLGSILIVLGLPTGNVSSPPSGIFELAKLPFRVETGLSNQSAALSIDNSDIQAVDMGANVLTTQVSLSSLTLNPLSTQASGQIRLQTSRSTRYVGEVFPVEVSFSTGASFISSLSFRITYPYSGYVPELQVVDSSGKPISSLTPNNSLVSSGSWVFPVRSVKVAGGVVTIDFSAVNTDVEGYNNSSNFTNLTTIYFKVNRPLNSLELAFDPSETMMVTKNEPVTNILKTPSNLSLTLLADTVGPSAITDLAVTTSTVSEVSLTWTSPLDSGGVSKAASYDLRYSTSQINDSNWDSAIQVSGEPIPSDPGVGEPMTVRGLSGGTTYYFAIRSVDSEGNWSALSNVATGTTGNSTLDFSFLMQGISISSITKSVKVTLETTGFSKTFTTNFISGINGVFSPVNPIELVGVPVNQDGTSYNIFVQSAGRLRKKLGSLNISSGANKAPISWSSLKILAGDFNGDNTLDIMDIGSMLSIYTALSVPLNTNNSLYDVDGNGVFNISDIAIVLSNYTALEIKGD